MIVIICIEFILGQDPDSESTLDPDPDPDSMYPDPHPWIDFSIFFDRREIGAEN